MQQLFQVDPLSKNYYIPRDKHGNPCKNRTYTDNREAYQNGASKKTQILRWNNRIPTQEFVLHFLKELLPKDIRERRKKIFRYLKEHGLEAVASIELTEELDETPNNCVHFHILTDDKRSDAKLRKLIETACRNCGLVKDIDFCITYEGLNNGYWRFNYFTKYGKKYFFEVILFEKGTGLQKFYEIGRWFRKPQEQIWEDIKAFMRDKDKGDPDKVDVPDLDDEYLTGEPVQEIHDDKEHYADNKLPDEPQKGIKSNAEQSNANLHETSDKFVWLKYRNGYIPIDKRLLIPNDCPDVDSLPTQNIWDQRDDWKRNKYSVAFRQ